MDVKDFDYTLPPDLIAQVPAEPRDAARLLVVRRGSTAFEHRHFRDVGEYLHPGDLLVVNDSRVINARLRGQWTDTGGAVEALLLHPTASGTWEALLRSGRRLAPGRSITWNDGSESQLVRGPEDGVCLVTLPDGFDLDRAGELPLPPYIHEMPADPGRYQTVYADQGGSVAAPTAGLHFTPGLLERLEAGGVWLSKLTLHVGIGTFRPVAVEAIADHRMHAEFGSVPSSVAQKVLETRDAGRRVVAVGTTTVRLLEQWAAAGSPEAGWSGWTEIFITPGFRFVAVDAMITNFHLPRSTLLMLVSALAGDTTRIAAYEEAVRERYRFYSFGDAMLIL